MPGYARRVAVAGEYAYVADWGGSLRVVDISDPFSPTEVGFYDTPEWISSVAVAGDYAYVADYLAGLRMVDVSDPASPTEVGFYDMPGYARGVAIAGDYAYVADEWSGLRVVDVSDPASPTEVGFYDMLGWAYGVAVTGDYAYVADRDGGLRVVDVSDPASPTEVGSCDTPGYARDVAVAGNYAYVADGDGGLIILRFTSGAQTFSISGHVHNGSDNPIPGVTVSAGTGGSATTDASGAYTIINVMTGTYTLTPSKSGWMFTPASRMVNVPPSATGRDFMGSSETLLVSLSADPSEGTVPLNDVDLAAEVSGSAVGTINYTFYCNRSDAGTNITPDWDAKFDGVFDNPKTAVDVCDYSTAGTHTAKVIAERGSKQAEDRVTIDVSGAPTFSVSGHVHDGSGKPISGVTVSGASGSASTDASGAYTITGFITGTYTITPSKSGWTFTPATRAVSVPPGATGQDFTGYDRPPIVLVHGFQGLGVPWNCDDHDPNNTFQEVDDYLRAAGYYTVFAYLETSPCYTPPLVENVPRLRSAIALAKATTNQDKVILVAHSMGGLVSRAYIENRAIYEDDVAALFTFGSPHWGVLDDLLVFFANGVPLVEYCAEWQPAACEFSVAGMISFNRDYKKQPDVVYHLISGDAPNSSRNWWGKITGAIIPGADDAIVPTISGIGQAGIIDRLITDEVHGTGSGKRSYFIRDHGSPSTSYMQCLKPVLVTKTTDTCGNGGLLQVTAEATSTLTARTSFEYGTLLPTQSVTRTISLEGGPTLFAAQWQSGTLAVTLVDSNDQVIDPAYAASHPDVVSYGADETAANYYFTDTIAGAWQLVLQATSAPMDGSAYTTFAAFESDLALTAGTDRLWYTLGASATITASLTGSPASATVTATILPADGVTDSVTLLPQGSGQYQATYTVPDAPGYAEVRLVATGTTASSTPFERGRNLLFQISPNSVALIGVYSDTPQLRSPGSSFYEALSVTVGINAAVSGTVGLSVDLVDATGNFVAHSLTIQDVVTGTGTLTLRFDGDDIYDSRRDGPYTLTNLLLTDQRGATLVVTEAENVYTTAAYAYHSFGTGEIYLPLVMRNH